jgi:hypothetical protein
MQVEESGGREIFSSQYLYFHLFGYMAHCKPMQSK